MAARFGSMFRWSTAVALLAAGIAWGSAPPAGASTSSVSINFDNVTAPCNFTDTVALTKEYKSLGVVFKGKGLHNGGGILNECANFGVTGYSAPNFLGFNVVGNYSDGGSPHGPERITFTNGLKSHVQIKVGSADGTTLTLRAYTAKGVLLKSSKVTLTSVMQVVSVDVAGIKYVMVGTKTPDWILDDLSAS